MTRFASLDELRSACLDLPGGHHGSGRRGGRPRSDAHQAAAEPRPARRGGGVARALAGTQPAAARQCRDPGVCRQSRRHRARRLGLSGRGHRADGGEFRRRRRRHQSARAAFGRRAPRRSRSTSIIPTADFTAAARHGRGRVSRRRVGGLRGALARGRSRGAGRDGHRQYHCGLGDRGGFVRRRWRTLCRPRHRRRRYAASSASARRSTPALGQARCASSAIRCASPRRSADASLPPSSALRSPRGIGASRRCSTASSAPPPWRPWPSSAPTRSTMRSPVTCRPRRDIGSCLRSLALHPLLDLGMRLGEGSGAAVAVLVLARRARLPHRHGDLRAGAGVGEGRLDSWRWRGRTCR